MSSFSSNPPANPSVGAAPNTAQAVQTQIEQVAAEVAALTQQLDQLIRDMERLLAQEPRPPRPNATPAQLRDYQAGHDRWSAVVDQLQERIDSTRAALAQIEKTLGVLVSRLPAALARDAATRAYAGNLRKQVGDLAKEIDATRRALRMGGVTSAVRQGLYTRLHTTVGRVRVTARGLPQP